MLWLFLVFISGMSIWDFTGAIIFDVSWGVKIGYIVFFSILKASVLTLLYSLARRNNVLWISVIILISLYVLVSLVNFVSFQLYGFGISRKLILILAQTTPSETYNFMPGLIHNISNVFKSWTFYAVCIAGIILGYAIKRCGKRTFGIIVATGCVIGFFGFAAYCMSYTSGRSAHFLFARIVKYSREVAQWNNTFEELSRNKRPLPDVESVSSDHLANTVVVVVGESASRGHWSMYGYPLPTNHLLDAMTDSLVVFSDVIASAKATSGNMERILSFKEDDTTFNDGLEFPLLIDFFKEAGYKTFWLSNQEKVGSVSNTSGVMVMNSDVIKYIGADNSEDALCKKYDEALIPYFDESLKDSAENKLIFLHLLGSHSEYKTRYPASFNIFGYKDERAAFNYEWLSDKMAQRRAEYDNSIRYTDALLAEILERVSKMPSPAVFLYLSDHGENVYDEGSFTGRDDSSVEIPFIIFANQPYRSRNDALMDRLEVSKSRPFSSANVIHLLLSLTGSRYSHYESRLDVISDEYVIKPRLVDEEVWPREHVGK